jgi:hypothetical protein
VQTQALKGIVWLNPMIHHNNGVLDNGVGVSVGWNCCGCGCGCAWIVHGRFPIHNNNNNNNNNASKPFSVVPSACTS